MPLAFFNRSGTLKTSLKTADINLSTIGWHAIYLIHLKGITSKLIEQFGIKLDYGGLHASAQGQKVTQWNRM